MGWKRSVSEHGVVLSLQLALSEADARNKQYDSISLAMNDRQLRSLARDLQRAAEERGIDLWAEPKPAGLLSRLRLRRA